MNIIVKPLRLAWKMRRAWWFTATARTRARFARTALGSFWLGLSNLLSIGVLALVYGTVFQTADFAGYVVYLGVGLVIWNSIAASIGSAPSLFEVNARNILNNNIHPIFYTLEEWSFQLQTFAQSFALVLIVLSFLNQNLLPHLLTVGLLPLLNLLVFIYWFPLVICLLGARYRDLFQLVPIVLQLVFLLSPILYEKKNLGHLAWIAKFNPIYRILSQLRDALITGHLGLSVLVAFLIVNTFGVLCGVWLLEKQRPQLPFLF